MSVSGSRRSGRGRHLVTGGGHVPLIVWCPDCSHQVEPDPAEIAASAETTVIDWRGRLVCSRCGSRQVDMVVSGTK
jgi:hypothetical protein